VLHRQAGLQARVRCADGRLPAGGMSETAAARCLPRTHRHISASRTVQGFPTASQSAPVDLNGACA
jgi:hypothetical protein